MNEGARATGLHALKAALCTGSFRGAVWVQVSAVQLKRSRADKDYLEVHLTDSEDTVVLRFWPDAPQYQAAQLLLARQFVEISGEWSLGQFGIDVRQPAFRALEADETAVVLSGSEQLRARQNADFTLIRETVGGLRDPRLRALCLRFLELYEDRFRRTGAARDYHHARRGGLAQHVAQMMRSSLSLALAYPQLNRDLLIAGVLFHDCGKLWENCYASDGFIMPYDDRGELLGHIGIGVELVNRLWRDIIESHSPSEWLDADPPNEEVRLHLLHLIASHHGELQFGSPVFPKTPEAIVLHHVDNIDAKLEMMTSGYATSQPLGKNILERRRPLPGNLVRPLKAFNSGLVNEEATGK